MLGKSESKVKRLPSSFLTVIDFIGPVSNESEEFGTSRG